MYEIQTDDHSCVPVAVRNAYRKLGYPPPPLSVVSKGLGCSAKGTRFSRLEKFLQRAGFNTAPVDLHSLDLLSSAAVILFIKLSDKRGHAVLLEAIDGDDLVVINHVQGEEYVERSKVSRDCLAGCALAIFG